MSDLYGKKHVIAVHYLSRRAEIRLMQGEAASATIGTAKSISATHGIPDVVSSDKCSQFASAEFREFAEEYQFTHTTSSPRYPQSNGEAERAVQTVKKLLKKADDSHIALLMYRASPLVSDVSPAEILMGRKLRTEVPTLPSTLNPQPPDLATLKQKEHRQMKSSVKMTTNTTRPRSAHL